MPEQTSHRLPEEFGGNEWLVDELYEQFRKDRHSVDKKWWDLFDSFETEDGGSNGGAGSAKAPSQAAAAPERPAPSETESTEAADPATKELPVVKTEAPAPKASGESPAATQQSGKPPVPNEPAKKPETSREEKPATKPIPAQLPKSDRNADMEENKVSVLRGPAKAISTNMEASLSVPTATSVRAIPAKLLIDNRVVINSNLARARGGKVSFTHLIGYAIIRALAQFPSQNVYYDVVDGKPSAVQPAHVNFGLAIDMPKPDGTRSLVVPNIKKAETMNFAEFWQAYENLVKKARAGKLGADDYAGTTV